MLSVANALMYGGDARARHESSKDDYYNAFEQLLHKHQNGPFFLGQHFTYADLLVFRLLRDDNQQDESIIGERYPLLGKHMLAVKSRARGRARSGYRTMDGAAENEYDTHEPWPKLITAIVR